MDLNINSEGYIKKRFLDNFVNPFVRAVQLSYDDVIFDNAQDLDRVLFLEVENNQEPTHVQIFNFLKVNKVYLDKVRENKIPPRSITTFYNRLAFYISILIDGSRKRFSVTKGEYTFDSRKYVSELLRNPSLPNNFLDQVIELKGDKNDELFPINMESTPKSNALTEVIDSHHKLLKVIINGEQVMRCMHERINLNGEFQAYFLLSDGKCCYCNCEYTGDQVRIITTTESTINPFSS